MMWFGVVCCGVWGFAIGMLWYRLYVVMLFGLSLSDVVHVGLPRLVCLLCSDMVCIGVCIVGGGMPWCDVVWFGMMLSVVV